MVLVCCYFLSGLFKSSRDEGLSVTNRVFLLAPFNESVPLKHCLYSKGGNMPINNNNNY